METSTPEPSVFAEGFQQSYYDELFLEWIALYTPRFYFKPDAVLCYFLRDGKPFYTRAEIRGRDKPGAIKFCIRNVTHDRNCLPQDKNFVV